MSHAANPNKPKRSLAETEAAAAAKQQKADRERIRRLIITLGDENKKVLGQIRGLAGALGDDVELHGDLMADTVLECAKNLPMKTGIFAAWIARMADKHATWVAALVPRLVADLQEAVRGGRTMVAILLLRFLAGLANTGLIGLSPILGFLGEVSALSEGLRVSKGGDLGIFLTLATLPFLSPASHAKVAERVDSLMSTAGAYIAARDARWKPLLRVLKTEEAPDRLEALASALRAQREAKWSSQAILHVPGFEPSLESRPDMPSLPPLGISAEDIRKSKIRVQMPLVASRLLTSRLEDDGADDQLSEHDRWLLEDYILITIEMFGRDVDECAKQILRIPVLHPHFEAIVIETVFSEMLRLPSPSLLPVFYSRLLQAIAEKQKSTEKLVAQAYVALFERSPDLDEEAVEVLAEAYAYDVMHNSYQSDWSPFTGDTVSVQAQRLLRRSLERLQRLSFHQNLLHKLPETVHVYVPPEPLPASGLSMQEKPEFARMLGLVKIKDPDDKKVLQYCKRLLKVQAKKEEQALKDEASGLAPVVEPSGESSGLGVEKEEDDGNEAPQAKRRRLDGGKEAEELVGIVAGEGEPKTEKPDMAAKESGAAKAGSLQVKEEVKHEEESSTKVKADKAPPLTAPKQDEEDFGEAPSEPWTLGSVLELLIMAMLQNGAKTPTHMSKVLDGYQQVFTKLRPTDDEEAHNFTMTIVRCIFEFWRLSGQRLEITIDTLFHRGILNSRAIVEHALAERGPHGCDSMAIWNMINGVARKSLENSQSVRAELTIAKRLGKTDVAEKCKKQLDNAIQETAELFTLVFTGLVRNHHDFEEDMHLRQITLQRTLSIGRKYHAFIKPLIDTAESRIPGVAHNPEIAAVFQSLGAL